VALNTNLCPQRLNFKKAKCETGIWGRALKILRAAFKDKGIILSVWAID
jgi:hypothetical protein